MTPAPVAQLSENSCRRTRIVQRSGSKSDERCTGHEILNRIGAARHSSDADERNLHCPAHFPYRENTDGQKSGSTHTSTSESQRWPSSLEVDDQSGDRVHQSDSVSASVDSGARRVGNRGKCRGQFHENGFWRHAPRARNEGGKGISISAELHSTGADVWAAHVELESVDPLRVRERLDYGREIFDSISDDVHQDSSGAYVRLEPREILPLHCLEARVRQSYSVDHPPFELRDSRRGGAVTRLRTDGLGYQAAKSVELDDSRELPAVRRGTGCEKKRILKFERGRGDGEDRRGRRQFVPAPTRAS